MTLKTQNSDVLGFYDLAAFTLKAALEAALNSGYLAKIMTSQSDRHKTGDLD
jgi:hypothetical protein